MTKRKLALIGLLLILAVVIVSFIAYNTLTSPAAASSFPQLAGTLVSFDSRSQPDGSRFTTYAYWQPQTEQEWVLIVVSGYRLPINHPLMVSEYEALTELGYSTLFVDLPDSGGRTISDGRVNFGLEEQWAILGAYDWLTNQGYERIGIVSQSMGAYAALRAATLEPGIQAIWMDSPLTNLAENAQYRANRGAATNWLYPLAFGFARIAQGDNFYDVSLQNLNPVNSNIRIGITSCQDDPAVPPWQANAVHDRFPQSQLFDDFVHEDIHPCVPASSIETWQQLVGNFFAP